MSTLVRYTPEDRILDLAHLSGSDYELISSLHGNIVRGEGTLLCLRASSNQDAAEMYIRRRGDRYWAVHFAGDAHGSHEVARESDEHRRQKDYWCRAAEDAGYTVSREFSTGRGTILDVAIEGPRRTGVEIQHSYNKTKLVKSRTTKSYRAGWLPIWFLNTDKRPAWFHAVPAVNSNPIPWSSLPPRRAATALGLSRFSPARCVSSEFDACPAGRKRPCGGWHPKREPWGGLTVDDVAAMVPAEQILPMRDTRGFVHLVSPESLRLYTELTGHTGQYIPDQRGSGWAPARRTSGQQSQGSPERCACGQRIYPLTRLRRVRYDVCERCRIALGLPSPYLPG